MNYRPGAALLTRPAILGRGLVAALRLYTPYPAPGGRDAITTCFAPLAPRPRNSLSPAARTPGGNTGSCRRCSLGGRPLPGRELMACWPSENFFNNDILVGTADPVSWRAPSRYHSAAAPWWSSMPDDLSEALKLATKDVHELAENSEFMRNFQKGLVTREQFTLLLDSLYFIYTALEEEIERNKDHPAFAPVYFPSELHRTEALAADLEYFHGPGWRDRIECPQATGKYVSRIQRVGRSEPELLVAHAYIRYLGDLSGGQVLKKVAQKALKLPNTGQGVAFFSFDRVTNATKFKQLYRSRMNTLDADRETRQRILGEANRAFQLNVELFNELQELSSGSEKNSAVLGSGSKIRKRTIAQGQSVPTGTNQDLPTQPSDSLTYSSALRFALLFGLAAASLAIGWYLL